MKRKLLTVVVLLCASTAAAQTPSTPKAAFEPSEPASPAGSGPVQLSLGAGGVTSLVGNGADARVMFSFPRSDRRAFEGFVGVYGGNDALGTKAVYGFQVRERIRKGTRRTVEPFWTYGLMGAVARYETSSCVNKQCTSQFETRVLPPILGLVGAGLEYTVKPRLSVRFDYQAGLAFFVPIGVRAGASVSVPLGRTTPRRSAE